MSEPSAEPRLVTREPQPCAVVRETVPMGELPAFFSRAFGAAAAAAGQQGRRIVGPPFGIYFGMPSETVDVAAGFPIDAQLSTSGEVAAYTLPGGRAVEVLHVGSYDSLGRTTYARLMAWMQEHHLIPGDVMWESYLNEPDPANPDSAQTLVVWPVTSTEGEPTVEGT